jgi:hypothetical protein
MNKINEAIQIIALSIALIAAIYYKDTRIAGWLIFAIIMRFLF